MSGNVLDFYEELADYYHLIFDDWESAIERQARILGNLLASQGVRGPLKILAALAHRLSGLPGWATRLSHRT